MIGSDLTDLADRFRARSHLIRMDHHLPFAGLPELNDVSWSSLEHLVFAILKPDAVAGGLVTPILGWLRRRGYTVRYADILWNPQERQFEELYKFNLTLRNDHNQIGSWWLNRQLYTLGPSVLLLIENGSDPRQVYDSIASDKGPSDPLKAKAGQLRHDFRATNMTMNLFHCADDPFSTVREFLIFRDMITLTTVLDGHDPAPALDLQLAALDQPRTIDATLAARKLVLRLLLECRLMSPDLQWPAEQASSVKNTREALVELRSLFTRTAQALGEQRGSSFSPHEECLRRLLRFPYLTDDEMKRLLHLLEACGIATSRWDALALVSTCHYVAGQFRSLD